jgi:hypothetical protein
VAQLSRGHQRLTDEELIVTVTRRARRQAAVVATLGLTLVASGCTDDAELELAPVAVETAPSPTPSETLDEAGRLEQRNVEAAEQQIRDFWAHSGRVGEDGYEDWQDLADHFSSEMWGSYAQVYRARAEQGGSATGAVVVEDLTVTDYQPSENGYERVAFEGCTDWSGVAELDADGETAEPTEGAKRYMVDYEVAHSGPDSAWRITGLDARTEESC